MPVYATGQNEQNGTYTPRLYLLGDIRKLLKNVH